LGICVNIASCIPEEAARKIRLSEAFVLCARVELPANSGSASRAALTVFSQTHSLHARISQDASADAGTRPAEVDAVPTTEPAFKHYNLGERPDTLRLAKHPDQVKVLLSSAHHIGPAHLGRYSSSTNET